MTMTDIAIDSQKLLRTFLELVRLDSPSGAEGPVREYLIERVKALGLSHQVDSYGNVVVTVPGNTQSDTTLAITGHMDVVPPCLGVQPVLVGDDSDDILICSDKTTVLGADDKAGLAPMLEALELSLKDNLPRPNLLFLWTVREELAIAGARDMDPALYGHADFVIGFDHTGKMETLIYEAPTYINVTITVHGKSVHAGIMPEKGINAIKLLSEVLAKCQFGQLDDNTTSNIGFIKGGKATNIVPDLAVAQCELRGHNDTRLEQELVFYQQMLAETIDPVEGASYEFTHDVSFRHYKTVLAHDGVQKTCKAMETLGLKAHPIRTNGGSDVNVFTEHGVPGIVLSAGYMEPHSLNERVYLKDMVICTRLLLAIWEQFAHG